MSKRYNMDCAIRLEWRKCLEIMWLILFELADFKKNQLMDFKVHFWEYLQSSQVRPKDLEELLVEFRTETGLHLDEVKLHGDYINKAQKTVDSICFQIGGVILWGVAEWEKKDVRLFVYRCWDYLQNYNEVYPRITAMKKELKIKIGDYSGKS